MGDVIDDMFGGMVKSATPAQKFGREIAKIAEAAAKKAGIILPSDLDLSALATSAYAKNIRSGAWRSLKHKNVKKFKDEFIRELGKNKALYKKFKEMISLKLEGRGLLKFVYTPSHVSSKGQSTQQLAFTRMSANQARKMLRDAYETTRPPPPEPKVITRSYEAAKAKYEKAFSAFYNKYEKRLTALSDGLRAGLVAIGENPKKQVWSGKLTNFVRSYAFYLEQEDRSDSLIGTGTINFPIAKIPYYHGKKFRDAFRRLVKAALGKEEPKGIVLELKGGFPIGSLIVSLFIPKRSKLRMKGETVRAKPKKRVTKKKT